MSDFLWLWLIIGVGNMFSHVVTCESCRRDLGVLVVFLAECVAKICLWPVQLYLFMRPPPILRKIHVEKRPGETREQFLDRKAEEINRQIREVLDESEGE